MRFTLRCPYSHTFLGDPKKKLLCSVMLFVNRFLSLSTQPRGSNLSSTSAVAWLKVWPGWVPTSKQNLDTLPETNISTLKIGRDPKGNDRMNQPSIFRGDGSFREGTPLHISNYAITRPTATVETSVLYTKQGNDQFRCN